MKKKQTNKQKTNLSPFPGSDCRSSVFAISITAEELSCNYKIQVIYPSNLFACMWLVKYITWSNMPQPKLLNIWWYSPSNIPQFLPLHPLQNYPPPLKNWFTARVFSDLTEVSKKMGIKKYIFAPITGDRGLNERREGALQLNLGGGMNRYDIR